MDYTTATRSGGVIHPQLRPLGLGPRLGMEIYDHLFRFFLLGNSTVGKSAMLVRFTMDSFNSTYITTIGKASFNIVFAQLIREPKNGGGGGGGGGNY